MTTDILKRDEVIKVQFGNFPSTITSDKIHKSSCYLRKIYIYDIPLSQGGSAHHPIIAVFSRILQISHKKYVSMTNVDCKFLTNILPFYFNINFLKIFTGTKKIAELCQGIKILPPKNSLGRVLNILLPNCFVRLKFFNDS